ncbi:class I SAM-dependent methyltransferase [Pseudonocardia endophytica]|uniref:Nodulation protein S (NodS) n=1 Tax=Pseudonocardia endophytica TaxID=401976 RepID=A0A4R1HMJ0_PSEEN|nr:class I SAM-dependent methyltransferase [Pseudonocardia endophytica]TCK20879.1 nodulation protein S (NodS) [Pseudonocardia endophytica]
MVLHKLPAPARRVARTAVRGAAVPTRTAVHAVLRRRPELARHVADWGWLWQPGWGRRHHERFYGATGDPYGFDTKPFEQAKYDELLSVLPDGRYARGLEVGCAEGAFTERLATRCDAVVGTDISEVAIERARQRFAGRPEIELQRRTLPLDFPDGTFDAIVCSDVVYLWERGIVEIGLSTMIERLRPGGALVLLHYLGTFGQPIHANDVHELALKLGAAAGLDHPTGYVHADVGPHGAGFRVDVLARVD